MTREQAKEILPIIAAFADGKTIQYRYRYNGSGASWADVSEPAFDMTHSEYRIKPEPREWTMTVTDNGDLRMPIELVNGESIRVREIL